MFKESIICITIIALIVIGNYTTQEYTKKTVYEMKQELNGLRDEIIKNEHNNENEKEDENQNKKDNDNEKDNEREDKKESKDVENEDKNKISDKMENIDKKWEEYFEKLAFFIEHDELEKVEMNLTSLKSFIESVEYDEAINELDKCCFVLEHIQDKNAFTLMNIF